MMVGGGSPIGGGSSIDYNCDSHSGSRWGSGRGRGIGTCDFDSYNYRLVIAVVIVIVIRY